MDGEGSRTEGVNISTAGSRPRSPRNGILDVAASAFGAWINGRDHAQLRREIAVLNYDISSLHRRREAGEISLAYFERQFAVLSASRAQRGEAVRPVRAKVLGRLIAKRRRETASQDSLSREV